MADPITAGALALSAVGAGVSAAGTIAGGNASAAAATQAGANAAVLGQDQQNLDNYQAAQLQENASSEIGAAQRTMLDTQETTRLAEGTVTADAAGSGFTAGVGSPGAIAGSIAKRGNYQAAMNLFQGQNASTGDLNKAAGDIFSGQIALQGGEMEDSADQLKASTDISTADTAAIGNLASAGGSMFKTYGSMTGTGGTAGTMNVGGNSYVAYG